MAELEVREGRVVDRRRRRPGPVMTALTTVVVVDLIHVTAELLLR